jgi:hypothetical protein
MRDLGLIKDAKNCQEFAQKIWESCVVYVNPEAAHAVPVEHHGHEYRPQPVVKVDHITTLLNVIMAFARNVYLESGKEKTSTGAMKMVQKQNIDPYYDQL